MKKNAAENNEPEAENVVVTRKGKKPTLKAPTKNPIPNHHQPSETSPILIGPNTTNNRKDPRTQNKRTKRKRIRKNKTLTLAAININGIKWKIRSLENLLQSEKIGIALITETKLPGKDKINIKGYKWIGKNREDKNGGGVGLLISDELCKNTVEDNTSDEYPNLETKWIKLECRPKDIAIGVFYGPQENKTVEKVREIYSNLETQIKQKSKDNNIIIGGDFNAKLQVDNNNHKQTQSRNGKTLQEMLNNTQLIPVTTNADYGFYTRVNRNDPSEKSMIDYIMMSAPITKNISSTIIDEEGAHRVKSKKESDHNTILVNLKINDARKPEYIEKWKLDNKDGWAQFNTKFTDMDTKNEIHKKEYTEIEGTIRNLLKQTIGKQKIRTDKIPKPKSSAITQARKEKKTAKRRFEEACRTKSEEEKIIEKEKYQQTQRTLRSEIEKHEREKVEKRLKILQNRAKKNPNIIWQARKKVRRKTELDYNIITEDDRVLTCPEETKNHVAEYFKDLYQARPGTPEYDHWTQLITDTVQQATEKNTTNHHQPRQRTNKRKRNKQSH